MNYFAHGRRYVDRPYFLAGTAVPDWLSVCDREARVRHNRVVPHVTDDGSPEADVAAGVVRHLDDDRWFHRTRAFVEVSARLTLLARLALPGDKSMRPGFLGHILTEILLDSCLVDLEPGRIDQYYEALQRVDPALVQRGVNRYALRPTQRLAPLIRAFRADQFLRVYGDDASLLWRLNQVMRRVRLEPLPGAFAGVFPAARAFVADRAEELLSETPTEALIP